MSGSPPPRYVARTNEQALAPPYLQSGCALHAFALPADRTRMQRDVDRFLAEPTHGRVRPRVVADHVLLYFCDFAQSCSVDPDDARRGWLGEREHGVWIPILIEGSRTPSFFVGSMIVDSGPAMCSGREVLGFPKEIGVVGVAREPARASVLSVDVLAMAGGRTHAGRWQPLVELERIETASHASIAGPRALFGMVGAGLGRVDFVNLKQLRDAAVPTLACYQAVVRTSARLLALRRVAPTGPYAYRIHASESHPLVEALGVPARGHVRGIFCEFDFVLERGEQL